VGRGQKKVEPIEDIMAVLVTDPDLQSQLLADRQTSGADRYDEVWDGVYMMAPLPNNEHQDIQADFVAALKEIFGWDHAARICAGVNVSDRNEDWTHNYRCPDVVVFLPGNPAIDRGSHWQGGPDFLVEIVSEADRSEEKLPFYASVGVREVLLIDRNPWKLELYGLDNLTRSFRLAGTSTPAADVKLESATLPVVFEIVSSHSRPRVRLSLIPSAAATTAGRASWLL
jgi:Uma2 family endonuclease